MLLNDFSISDIFLKTKFKTRINYDYDRNTKIINL